MTKVSSLPSMAADDGDHILLQTANGVTALTPVGAGAGRSSGSDLPVVGVFVPSTMMGGQYYYTAGYNVKETPFDDPDRFAIPQVSYYSSSSSSELSWNNLLVAHHSGYSTSNLKKDAGNSVGRRLLFTKDPAVITEYIGRASSSEFLLTPYALDEQDSHLHVFLPFALSLSFLAGDNVHDNNEGSVQLWYDMLPFDESVLDGVLVHVQIPVNAKDDKDDGWPYLYENVWPVLHRLLRDERLGTCADYAYAGIGQFTHPKRTKPFADQLVGDKFESARYMFQGCDLSTAVFPNARFGNLVDARGMFVNTSGISGNLKKQFPNADFSSVERADWMFAGLDGTGFLWETDFMPNVRTASHMFEYFGPISTSGSDVRVDILLPQTMPNLEDASYMFASLSYGKSGDWSSSSGSTQRVLSQASIDALRDANWPNLRRASYMFAGNQWDTDTRNGRLNIDLSALATVKWPKLEDIDHIFYGYMENNTSGAPLLDMTKPGNLEAIKHLLSLATGRIDYLFGRTPTSWEGDGSTLSDVEIATKSNVWALDTASYANPFIGLRRLENITFTNLEDLSTAYETDDSQHRVFPNLDHIVNVTFSKLKRVWRLWRTAVTTSASAETVDGLHFPELVEHGYEGNLNPDNPQENILGVNRDSYNCSLRKITDLTAPKLENARCLLMNMGALNEVDGLDLSSATDVSYLFAVLYNMQPVSSTSNYTYTDLTLTMKNCDFSSAVNGDYMFYNYTTGAWPNHAHYGGRRDIVFGEGTTFPLLETARYMFANSQVNAVPKITNDIMPEVVDLSHMFESCFRIKVDTSPQDGPEIVLDGVENVSYMFANIGGTSVGTDKGDTPHRGTLCPMQHVRLTGIKDASYMMYQDDSHSRYDAFGLDGLSNIDFSTIENADHMFDTANTSNTVPSELADIDLSSLQKSNCMFRFKQTVNLATTMEGWSEKPWFEEVKARGGFDGIFAGCPNGCTFPTWVTDEMKTARKS